MNISFIGGGVMAEAIINGILSQKMARKDEIYVGEPVDERRASLKEQYGISVSADNKDVVRHGKLVVLSVKPQSLKEVLSHLKGDMAEDQAVLSIVAGAKMESISVGIGHQAVIRVMPNTPAQISKGMSVWTATPSVNPAYLETTRSILKTLGSELYVEEEKYIDMATALSASGPAYVFLFIESLVDAGVYLGMTREMARKLVLQTILGSTLLALETGMHTAELRDMVTSPGGTTAEALSMLEEGGFRAVILEAVTAAYDKAKSLGSV
ncbi:MAG: pyrroline-5-carboxylate reductase [SAR202 cluster bacterium Io17-Chloro-G3]|nr:MAG: pyrroline-5-carboxylate reductase [SAR202 cluster bacterium Io17-Chloro-G3]